MTKTFLLAATAITAIALTSPALAGSIDKSSTITAVPLTATSTGTPFGAFTIATEATDPSSSNVVKTAVGGAVIVQKLATPATVAINSTNTYEVIFTPSGGGKFEGTSTILADVTGTNVVATPTQLGLLADGTVSALFNVVGGASGGTIVGFTLTSGINASSETDIKVAAQVNLIASGVRIAVDSTAATTVVQFKPLLAATPVTATANTVAAALPNYTSFRTPGSPTATQATAALASGIKVNAVATATSDTYAGGALFNTLAAARVPATVATVIAGGTATVTGTAGAQLDKLAPKLDTLAANTGATDTTAVFTLADGSAIESTGFAFGLTEPTTAIALNSASYSLSFLPTFGTGFTAPTVAYGPVAIGSVTLEGTNFTAPWFTLNNANNTATLRIANNGSTPTGPVFATLKANNGTAAPTTARVQISAGLVANATLDVVGSSLATLFGTDAQNGDLQITIQGDGAVLSAKTRVRNIASGATFESSLGTLTGN